jgi:hypothetical protein
MGWAAECAVPCNALSESIGPDARSDSCRYCWRLPHDLKRISRHAGKAPENALFRHSYYVLAFHTELPMGGVVFACKDCPHIWHVCAVQAGSPEEDAQLAPRPGIRRRRCCQRVPQCIIWTYAFGPTLSGSFKAGGGSTQVRHHST